MGCASSNGLVPGGVLEGKDGAGIMEQAKKMLEDGKIGKEAITKINEIGGTIKEKMEHVVEDLEEKVTSIVGGPKSEVEEMNGGLEEMTKGFDSMGGSPLAPVQGDNGSRPGSSASTAEPGFPPDQLSDIKREIEQSIEAEQAQEPAEEETPEQEPSEEVADEQPSEETPPEEAPEEESAEQSAEQTSPPPESPDPPES